MIRDNSRTSKAMLGIITSFLQYFFVIVLQFLLAPIILRVAGKEVMGAYSFLIQVLSWAALTDLGFGVALSRNMAQVSQQYPNRLNFQKIFTIGRTFYLGSNTLFALIILIISLKLNTFFPLTSILSNQAKIALYLLALWTFIRTPLALFSEALISSQNIGHVNIIMSLGVALRLILSIIFVLLGGGLIGLMVANIFGEATTYLLSYYIYKKKFPNDNFGWGIPDMKLFKQMLGFGLTYMIVIISGRISANTDNIIVGYLYGASAVSIYYLSQTPGTMLFQLIWKLTDNSTPALNELHSIDAYNEINNAYFKLLRYSLLLVIPLSIGLFFFNKDAITLWVGISQYAGDAFTLSLSFFAITQVVIHLNCIILVAFGEIKTMGYFFLFSSSLKLILAFTLGKTFGITGVMLSNTIADIIGFLYFSHRVLFLLKIPINEIYKKSIFPVIKSVFFIFVFYLLIHFISSATSWFFIILRALSFLLISFFSIYYYGINENEKLLFVRFFNKKNALIIK